MKSKDSYNLGDKVMIDTTHSGGRAYNGKSGVIHKILNKEEGLYIVKFDGGKTYEFQAGELVTDESMSPIKQALESSQPHDWSSHDFQANLDKVIRALVQAEDTMQASMVGGGEDQEQSLPVSPNAIKKINRIKSLVAGLQSMLDSGEK